MTRRLVVSPRAAQDVDRLEQWLWDRQASAAAIRVADILLAAFDAIREHPLAAPGRRGQRERVVPFGQGAYVVRYRVFDETVVVTRVFHGRERR